MFKEDYKEYQKHIHPSRRMTEKILKRSKRQMKKANPVYRLAPLCLLILLFASPFVRSGGLPRAGLCFICQKTS